MTLTDNPFPADPDRHAIWAMLMTRDFDAFLAADWSMVEGDFIAEGFLGLHAQGRDNPDGWRPSFPTLAEYRDEWLRQAADSAATAYAEDLRPALFRVASLERIDLAGEIAVAHKKFDGSIAKADGGRIVLSWQTLYFCRRMSDGWKIAGFVGYLPFPMGTAPP